MKNIIVVNAEGQVIGMAASQEEANAIQMAYAEENKG